MNMQKILRDMANKRMEVWFLSLRTIAKLQRFDREVAFGHVAIFVTGPTVFAYSEYFIVFFWAICSKFKISNDRYGGKGALNKHESRCL